MAWKQKAVAVQHYKAFPDAVRILYFTLFITCFTAL